MTRRLAFVASAAALALLGLGLMAATATGSKPSATRSRVALETGDAGDRFACGVVEARGRG